MREERVQRGRREKGHKQNAGLDVHEEEDKREQNSTVYLLLTSLYPDSGHGFTPAPDLKLFQVFRCRTHYHRLRND